jgi:hypothetical protein
MSHIEKVDQPEQPQKEGILQMYRQFLRIFEEIVPIEWDRVLVEEDSDLFYGWIARPDGKRDFLLVEIRTYTEDAWHFITSSAKYSASFSKRLGITHTDCQKFTEYFTSNGVEI